MKLIWNTIMVCIICTGAFAQASVGPFSGTTAVNISLTGSSASWSNTGNVFTSDNNYASSSLSSNGDFTDYIQITNFGFNISSTSMILGIEVEIERFGSNAKDNQISIVKGGVISSTDRSINPSWSNTDSNSYTIYGTATDLWGETWVPSDINASSFGIAISSVKQGGGGTSDPNIDHIRITVHYESLLPVGFLSFEGKLNGTSVDLNWSTAWEQDNSHFSIQRSSNGRDFKTLGFVPGANFTETTQEYSFIDNTPVAGLNFYRLKQHDFSGTYAYSEMISVFFEASKVLISIEPTYITQSTTFTIPNTMVGKCQLIVSDLRGKVTLKLTPKKIESIILYSSFPKSDIYIYRLIFQNRTITSGKLYIY